MSRMNQVHITRMPHRAERIFTKLSVLTEGFRAVRCALTLYQPLRELL